MYKTKIFLYINIDKIHSMETSILLPLPVIIQYDITKLNEYVIKEIYLDFLSTEKVIEKIVLNINDAPTLKQSIINELQKITNK